MRNSAGFCIVFIQFLQLVKNDILLSFNLLNSTKNVSLCSPPEDAVNQVGSKNEWIERIFLRRKDFEKNEEHEAGMSNYQKADKSYEFERKEHVSDEEDI